MLGEGGLPQVRTRGSSLGLPSSLERGSSPEIGKVRTIDARVEPPEFRVLYAQFFPLVWRWAARLGIPPHAIDDVVQETFLTIYSELDDFEGRSSLKTWVFGVTVGVTRNYRRRRATAPLSDGSEIDALPDRVAHPEAVVASTEALALIQQILDGLDVEKREVFVLAELEQLSRAEIATVLEISSNTVASRLRLAREAVRAAWERAKARDQWRTR